MEILLQRKQCWLDPEPRCILKKCTQISLLSKEGQAISLPIQLLAASSPFINSILMTSFSWESSTASISLPSVTHAVLQLLAQILSMGETEESGGLETTMTYMIELQNIFTFLGMNVKLCPKLSSSNLSMKAVPSEVLMFEGTHLCGGRNPQNQVGLLQLKKSTTKKHSTGKFSPAEVFKETDVIIGGVMGGEEFVASCQAEEGFDDVKFEQSGLLQDFKVDLVECTSDRTLEEGERSLIMCNICGVEVNKYASLKRHYREKHGIQDEKPSCKVKTPSVIKCTKCVKKFSYRSSFLKHFKRVHKNEIMPTKCETGSKRKVQRQEVLKSNKEGEVSIKIGVANNNGMSEKIECNECGASIHRSSLRRHKRRFHEGKTYGCGVCDKITAYRYNMVRHCTIKGHDKNLIYCIAGMA